jgi:hypothetical protein
MRASLLAAATLLAACGQQSAPPAANRADAAPPAADRPTPAPRAFVFDEEGKFYEFHFGWSPEVAAIPQLVSKFRTELDQTKAKLKASAAEAANHTYSVSKDILTKGQSDRLLSLATEVYEFSGGAHGNSGTGVLLWDRHAAKEINLADLLAAAGNRGRLLTQPWCDALNKAREEKRGEPVEGSGMFQDCPSLDDIAIIPTDKDGNDRFERLMLVASPYVAGPYAEGSYEIELMVTPELVAAMKSEFRPSFEAQGRQ